LSNIKKLRKEIGYTQNDVSKELSISQSAVSQIENDPTYSENFKSYLRLLVKKGADINTIFKEDK